MRIGLLAMQGDTYEWEKVLEKLGHEVQLLKKVDGLNKLDTLILPSGEKNTLHFLYDQGNIIWEIVSFSKPIFAIGANIYFLGNHLSLLDVKVNEFSKTCYEDTVDILNIGENIPVTFIRPPIIEEVGENVQVLAKHKGKMVMLKEKNIYACTFQPQLIEDDRIIIYFLNEVSKEKDV